MPDTLLPPLARVERNSSLWPRTALSASWVQDEVS